MFKLFTRGEPAAWIWLPLVLMVGCQNQTSQMSTEYGKINGLEGGISLNGTGVFSDMFVARGFKLKRSLRISPRIKNYQTLVWFPDSRSCPKSDAVDAINNWLESGESRTLIYVGRGYTAQGDYLSEVMRNSPSEQKEEILRLISETELPENDLESAWWKDDLSTCDWFRREDQEFEKTRDLSGTLVPPGLDVEIEQSSMLVPSNSTSRRRSWVSTPLVTANGRDFAFKLNQAPEKNDSDSKLVVITNGSFLLNYSLVDRDDRIIAGKLIDLCDPTGDVMFLESGPNGIRVSKTDTNNHNNWAWIAEPPLRYIIPHFLMWGILFCFVYFPIFGRPRKMKIKSASTFRSHVNALGRMIGRSDQPNRAVNKILRYQQLVGGDSKRKKDDQK